MEEVKSILITVLLVSSSSFGQTKYTGKDIKKMKLEKGMYANISTTRGDILLELEMDKTPLTVASFVGLAEGDFKNDSLEFTTPFFDGLKFHRVIANFMIQGGDPAGNGTGSPGYKFYDEFDSSLTHSGPGILSMANSGPNTNGSQFFITHKATTHLNNRHSVFGHVIKGQNVIDAIQQNDTIVSIKIYRIGKTAKKFNSTEVFDEKQKEYKAAYNAKIEKAKLEQNEKLKSLKKDFFASMALKYPNATKRESGLMFVVENEGNGKKPSIGQTVTVHYTGYLTNGKKFDSSVDRGQPFSFPLGQKRVIAGWDEGLALMSIGSKHKLILPYWLAYGERGNQGIPPMATLIFDVELISFK